MLSGINKPSAGEQLYLLAFFIFLISETFSTTMFQLPGSAYTLCKAVACLLLIIKVFRFDEFSRRTFFIFVLLILEAILVYVNSGYMEVFFWVLFVMGAKNVSFKKILKVYLIVTISIVLLAFCASMLQVIENLQYTRGDGKRVRNSFGAIYTTDFASHIFMITMSAFYLLKDKLKTWHFILGAVVGVLVYWFCNTRLDMGCLFLMLICFYCISQGYVANGRNIFSTGKAKKALPYSMPIAAGFMFVVSYFFSSGNPIFLALDSFMSTRLELGHKGLMKYGMTLFGQSIKMVGNGGTTKISASQYFFIDCSYLYIFLRYGVFFLLITLAVYMMCCKKFQNDPYFIVVIILISINCMIAHHIIELTYNPFALALFATVPHLEQRDCRSNNNKWSRLNLLK